MDTDVTDRLREAAKAKGVETGADFARLLGIPESTARSYLNGTRKPSYEACEEIGRILGVPGRWLFDGTAPREQRAAQPARERNQHPTGVPSPDIWRIAIEEAILDISEFQDLFDPLADAAPKIARAILATVYGTPLEVGELSQEELVREIVRLAMKKLRSKP